MNYDQLLALDAIVTTGTFRGAADKLYKSQSAISHSIKNLEDSLNMQLLSREAYRPTLTEQGEVYYRQAQLVLQQMRELRQTANQLQAGQEAKVNIAVSATCPISPVLQAIRATSARFPTTHIRLQSEMMGGAAERLLNSNDAEQADVVIASLEGIPIANIDAHPFCNIQIVPVAAPALFDQSTIHTDKQENTEVTQPPDLPDGTSLLTRAMMQQYIQVIVSGTSKPEFAQSRDVLEGGLRWTVSDFATKQEILLAGMGWGGMPRHLITQDLQTGKLQPLNIEGFAVRHTQLYVMRLRERALGKVATALFEQLSCTQFDLTSAR